MDDTPRSCWTRGGCVAAVVAGALACLMVGMLAGVEASGGKPSDVVHVLRDPAAPATADVTTGSDRSAGGTTVTVTEERTVRGAAVTRVRTVTEAQPASTVTQTQTETVTETAPPTSSTTSPPAP